MRTLLNSIKWIFYALAALWLALSTYMILTAPMIIVGGTVMVVLFILALLLGPALGARYLVRRMA